MFDQDGHTSKMHCQLLGAHLNDVEKTLGRTCADCSNSDHDATMKTHKQAKCTLTGAAAMTSVLLPASGPGVLCVFGAACTTVSNSEANKCKQAKEFQIEACCCLLYGSNLTSL